MLIDLAEIVDVNIEVEFFSPWAHAISAVMTITAQVTNRGLRRLLQAMHVRLPHPMNLQSEDGPRAILDQFELQVLLKRKRGDPAARLQHDLAAPAPGLTLP
jgi:hypothetical protein